MIRLNVLALLLVCGPALAQDSGRVKPHSTPGAMIERARMSLADGQSRTVYNVTTWDARGNSRTRTHDGKLVIIRSNGRRIELDARNRLVRHPPRGVLHSLGKNHTPKTVRTPLRVVMPKFIDAPPVDLGIKIVNGREARGTLRATRSTETVDFAGTAQTTEVWAAMGSNQWLRKIVIDDTGRTDVLDWWYIDMPVGAEMFEVPSGFRLPKGASLRGD